MYFATQRWLSHYRPVTELSQQLACIVTVLQQQLGTDYNTCHIHKHCVNPHVTRVRESGDFSSHYQLLANTKLDCHNQE